MPTWAGTNIKKPLPPHEEKANVMPEVSIIIPVYNRCDLTLKCLQAVEAHTARESIEVIVVDNASTDGTPDRLDSRDWTYDLRMIWNKTNQGYAKANNQGAEIARGEYLLFLNNDTEVQENWLAPLLEPFRLLKHVGAVGARLLYPDGTIQHAGVVHVKDNIHSVDIQPSHIGHREPDHPKYRCVSEVEAVTGACLLIPRYLYGQLGGMDEAYWNGYEDIDLCFKILEAGYHIYYQGNSSIIHHKSQSGPERHVKTSENLLRLNQLWGKRYICQLQHNLPDDVTANDAATIVIVTFNSQRTIGRCLDRLAGTLRDHDEVVVVDNSSNDATTAVVREYMLRDDRIQLLQNQHNTGYSAAANQGARTGKHPYIAFLNPDALVTPRWIERLIFHLKPFKTAAVGPLSDCVAGLQHLGRYLSEEQLKTADGDALAEQLYRQYRQQRLESKLLIGFCMMIERHVFERLGGMDEHLFLGNDDLDLSWRLRLKGYRLSIAKDTVVFHEGQASFATAPKAFTDRLVRESTDYLYYKLLEHYGHGNVPSTRELWSIDWFNPVCRFDAFRPLTSLVMLTYNQIDFTKLCIESMFRHTRIPFELIVVDNGSTDGSLQYLSSLDRSGSACVRVEIIANETNTGFANGCNQGIRQSRGSSVVLINNDVVVTDGWLKRLLDAAESGPNVGMVGPRTNSVSGPQQIDAPDYDTRSLGNLEQFAQAFAERNKGSTTPHWRLAGYCLLIKRSVIDKIGGLDPRYKIGNFEDDDYCVRAHLAGFKSLIVNDCYVHHFGSQTFLGNRIDIKGQLEQNWARFKHKWGIDTQTACGETYHVPLPHNGFDPSKHVVSIDTRSSSRTPQDAPEPMQRSIHSGNRSDETEEKAEMATGIRMYQAKQPTGGLSMTLLDGVFERVVQYIAPQHKAEAAWILTRLVESNPNHSRAHHELGLLFYEMGDRDNAQKHLQKAVELNDQNAHYLKDLGHFHHVVNKDVSAAQRYYDQAIARDPEDADLLTTAAHLYTTQQAFDKAAVFYRKVLAIDPDNHQARDCLKKVEKQIAAQAPEVRAEELYAQAQNKFKAGDAVGAMTDLKQVLDLCPEHALALNDYGVLSYERGDKPAALEHYRNAVRLSPDNTIFLKNLADFHWVEEQDARTALELYIRVLRQCPEDMETLLNCAQICLSLGRHDDARDFTLRALEIEPDSALAGQLLQKIDDAYQSTDDPSDRETLYGQAQAKAAAGDIDGAIDELTRLIAEFPGDAAAYNDLGVLYYETGNREKALSCYRQAVDLAPDATVYLKNLADFHLMEQGRAEEAMELYIQVLEKDPLDTDSLFAAGVVCAKLEKRDDARTFYERVLEIEPGHEAAMQAMAKLDERERAGNHLSIVSDHPVSQREATG